MKPLYYLLIVLVATTLFSCGNMTEEIRVNEDYSGEYTVYSDMIPSIRNMLTEMQGMFGGDTLTAEQIEEKVWEDFPEKIDSIIDLRAELTAEELAADPKLDEYTKKVTSFMKGGREVGYVHMGLKFPFKDDKELEEFFKMTSERQKGNSSAAMFSSLEGMETEAHYTINEKVIKRECKVIGKAEIADSEKAMLEKMLGGGKIHTVVYTPKKIHKVKGDGLIEIGDKKVVFEYDMLKSMIGETSTSFEITLAD